MEPTRQRLLNAAIRIINEKGESGIRIEKLLKDVNVTAPSLYHHFGNREGLVVEAQAERFLRSIRVGVNEVVDVFNSCKTIEDLKGAVRFTLSLKGDAERTQYRLERLNALGAAYARPQLAAKIVEAHEAMVRDIANAMRPFQKQGLIRSDINLEMVVAWYNGSLIGGLLVELQPSALDPDDWNKTMIDALDHLLFGE